MRHRIFCIILAAAVLALSAAMLRGETPEAAAERIDRLIEAQLVEKKIAPNPPIDDATFLRRVHLDLVGRIPTLEEADVFFADSAPDRRGQLIGALLASEGYVSHFYHFWADILRINGRLGINETPAALEYAYRLWLKQALRENKPYDAFVRELVSARGHFWENGAVGYYHRDRGMPLDNMATTVRIFLGTRLECAQCHNHPFDQWTQMDFYHMAAFSYGIESKGHTHPNRESLRTHLEKGAAEAYQGAAGVKKFPLFKSAAEASAHLRQIRQSGEAKGGLAGWGLTEEGFIAAANRAIAARDAFEKRAQAIRGAEENLHIRVRYVTTREYGRDLKLPHDYQYQDAKPFDSVGARTMFGGEVPPIPPGGSTVEAYAAWMTSRENPTFTRVIANRLWSWLFGAGVFEPIDDITESTEITNPALMACLEDLMRDLDYDQRAFLSVLCRTRAYQRAATREEHDLGAPYFFPGPLLRRMSAEQIWDSVAAQVLPESDYFRPLLVRQLEAIERVRSIYDSLASLPAEEYITILEDFGETGDRIGAQLNRARQDRTKARAAGDEARVREKEAEEKTLTNQLGAEITKIQQRQKQEVPVADLLTRIGMVETPLPADGAAFRSDAVRGVPVMTQPPRPKISEPPKSLDADRMTEWRERTRAEYLDYVKAAPLWARASELDSPAPPGHFLRDFGQSDRDVVENASLGASVPQALNLLNGSAAEVLANRFTLLGRRLESAATPEEKAALIFQALLTRRPNEAEMSHIHAEIARSGEESAREALIWALLNTQRFLFVE